MAHANLGDGVAASTGACQHFGVDEKAVRLRQQVKEAIAAKDLECAIAVAHTRLEHQPHELIETPGIEASQPRIASSHAVADCQGIHACQAEQGGQVFEMKLTISIREGDALEACSLEARAESSPVAAIS